MRRLTVEQVRRLADLAHARDLAQRGEVGAARRIFATYGISYAAAEVSRCEPVN